MNLAQKILIIEDSSSKKDTVGFISEDKLDKIVISAINPEFSFEKPTIQITVYKNQDAFLRLTQYHDVDLYLLSCEDLIQKIVDQKVESISLIQELPDSYSKTVKMAQAVVNYAINNKIMIKNIDALYQNLDKIL